ncbi:hypothetical protein LTR04_001146 [Oleoguttula sp. CCFEE 6159]|nr:hypothetical protein LTR04_001146 [Oleoguttula sp. CCFEE 6159]
MARRELASALGKRLWREACPRIYLRRSVTTQSAAEEDLEPSSSLSAPLASDDALANYDPVAQARRRETELPASRYKFRPPKYYRGPLHPHQPPPPSDPSSRLFVPGPFTLPRLEQAYQSTIASDLMTLAYTHFPPGYRAPLKGPRLRPWEGPSPYYKNRPVRGPRGGDVLHLLKRPITFRNVPKLEGVTLHTMVPQAQDDSAYLHIAGMVLQAISNVRVTTHASRKSVAGFGLREGKFIAATATMKGEDMYHFLGKCIDVVLPRIKDWKGVRGSSGDSSGNISFGLSGESVALFPEVEVNYDMYPPRMIPGCHVTIHTSATNDRDARLLLSSIGIPFYGKQIN